MKNHLTRKPLGIAVAIHALACAGAFVAMGQMLAIPSTSVAQTREAPPKLRVSEPAKLIAPVGCGIVACDSAAFKPEQKSSLK